MPRNPNWPDKSFEEVVSLGKEILAKEIERGYTPDVEALARHLAGAFYFGRGRRQVAARLEKALQPVAASLRSKRVNENLKMLQALEEAGWRYLPVGDDPCGPGIWQHVRTKCNVNRMGGVFDNIFEAAKRTLESTTFQVLQEAQPHTA